MPRSSSQSGNIIIYILGAIFLMGLLIAMLRGSNTPGANIDYEQLMVKIADVQQYGNELEKAVSFVMQQGFSETDLRFAHPNADSAYGDITDTPRQQVFDKRGGGATFRDPPTLIQTSTTPWVFNAENMVRRIGTTCNTPDPACADLIAFLPNVTKQFCLQLNNTVRITNPDDEPPAADGIVNIIDLFDGTDTYIGENQLGDNDGYLDGHKEGCFEGAGTPAAGTYHYYRVLLAR